MSNQRGVLEQSGVEGGHRGLLGRRTWMDRKLRRGMRLGAGLRGDRRLMLYNAYELQRLWFAGASAWADASAEWLNNPSNPLSYSAMGPLVASALDVFAHASAPRGKPAFGFTRDRKSTRLNSSH